MTSPQTILEAVLAAPRSLFLEGLLADAEALRPSLRALAPPPSDGKALLFIREGRNRAQIAAILAASAEGWAFLCSDPLFPDGRDLRRASDLGAWAVCSDGGRLDPLPIPQPWPDACEYAALTSGSSGDPKCPMLPIGALARVCAFQAELFGLAPGRRCAWGLGPAWDASLSDIFSALLSGAELFPLPFSPAKTKTLAAFFRDQKIDAFDMPAALLPILAPEDFPSLRTIVVGGQTHDIRAAERWIDAGARIFNCYGPTETTVCASARRILSGSDPRDVGTPLPGAEFWIAESDGALARLAPGASGILVIGGANTLIGHRGQPELDDALLIPLPRGGRGFSTNDRVLVGSEGELLFLGRANRSAKLDGHLVCAEEIESAFRSAGAIHCYCIFEAGRAKVLAGFPDGFDLAAAAAAARSKLAPPIASRLRSASVRVPLLPSGKPDPAACEALADALPFGAWR